MYKGGLNRVAAMRVPSLSFVLTAGFALATALAASSGFAMSQGPRHSEPIPLPRDGNAAIQEEYEAARRAGTREAYDLFIARHPAHALAKTAQAERDRLPAR